MTKTEQNITNQSEKRESIWSIPFVILMCANFFSNMAAFSTSTTLPILASTLGASTAVVGLIVGLFHSSALIIRPIMGPAFDSFSRRRLLLIAFAGTSICMFLYGLSDSITMVIIVRFLHGVFTGTAGPLAMSLVSEFLPLRKFASGISIYALSNSCAQIVGPAVGLYLVRTIGFAPSYFLSGACIIMAMVGIFMIREPYHERLKYELKLDRMFAKEAVTKAIPLMLLTMAFSCVSSYIVLYGYTLGVEDMGFYFMVYACCLLATRPLFGHFADRVGSLKVVFVGIIFFALSFILLSQARDTAGFVVAAVVGSAGFGCCAPLLQSAALNAVSVEHRGAASNTTFTGVDLGSLVGPIIGGFVAEFMMPIVGNEALAYSDMWLIMLAPVVVAFVLVSYWIFKGRPRKVVLRKRDPNKPIKDISELDL